MCACVLCVDASPLHALGFGVGTGVVGAGILCTMTNPWLAWMGTGNTVLYAGAYTWLKRVSISNTARSFFEMSRVLN